MRFDLRVNSHEMSRAINYSAGQNVIHVATAANDGRARWIITTYPFRTYAAGSRTSFSSPFVRGTASLLVNLEPRCGEAQTADAISHAQWLGENTGKGLLDIEGALAAFGGE